MRKTSISSQPQDGRFDIYSYLSCFLLELSVHWDTLLRVSNFFRALMTQIALQIYDPTKKWERYTIHGD
uniref:Uncharacterized protein n=1 Tax=Arundo donax TaxID=35708 RepID=A0A0A9ARL7_ARUDO